MQTVSSEKNQGIPCSPIGFGWEAVGTSLEPIRTSRAPAPEDLLALISCGCKTGCKRGCGCVKHGLKCSRICTHCAGTGHSHDLGIHPLYINIKLPYFMFSFQVNRVLILQIKFSICRRMTAMMKFITVEGFDF